MQETERFRIELALQAQKHEQSLNRLNQAMTQQRERLQNEKKNCKSKFVN